MMRSADKTERWVAFITQTKNILFRMRLALSTGSCTLCFLFPITDLVNLVDPVHPPQPVAWLMSWCSSSSSGCCPRKENHRSHWTVSTVWIKFEKKRQLRNSNIYSDEILQENTQNRKRLFE